MKTDKYKFVKNLIDKITGECGSKEHIYRGTNQIFPGDSAINSAIYRNHEDLFVKYPGNISPINIEADIVDKAQPHFTQDASNIEILTDLRHYGGPTTLIDFSRNLMIALFFACNGESDSPGQLIALRTTNIPTLTKIEYAEQDHNTSIIDPARTPLSVNRSQFQSSVFVHAPQGFILKEYCNIYDISTKLKKECLEYLREFFNIKANTIYHELIGFLENEENFTSVLTIMYSGLAKSYAGYIEEGIKDFDEAIRLMPDSSLAYYNRGTAKGMIERWKEAIKDYNEAILLTPDNTEAFYSRGTAEAYFARGAANAALRLWNDAIKDFDEAIRHKRDYAKAYYDRGRVKEQLGDLEGSIADFNEAIRYKQDYAEAYYDRGLVKGQLSDLEGSIVDIKRARDLVKDSDNAKRTQ